MNEISSITINIKWWILFSLAFISFAATYFYMRIIVPRISIQKKILLLILRSLALFFILLLLFEPALQIVKTKTQKPFIYVFIDKSKSMVVKDSGLISNSVKNILRNIQSLGNDIKFFIFDSSASEIPLNDFNYQFNGNQTNFENIADLLQKNNDNISSAVILSDGNINSGNNSLDIFTKTGLPIFTVGLTDTASLKDIFIKNLRFNSNIYKGDETLISATIINSGFTGKSVKVKLYQEDHLIDEKIINLSATNINHVDFKYKPMKAGKFNFHVSVDVLKKESNRINNLKFFSLNILENKLRITILASSPSNDFAILKEAIESDTNRIVSSLININKENDFQHNKSFLFDSTDVFVLIGFPSISSSQSQISKVAGIIRNKKAPFFFLVNRDTEISKLNDFKDILPFHSISANNKILIVNAEFSELENIFISKKDKDEYSYWNNLPPILVRDYKYSLKNNIRIIAYSFGKSVNKKEPLILYTNENGIKCVSFLGWNFWRWTLQNSEYSKFYFNSFINNIIKWLSLHNSTKRFIVTPIKNNFYQNEEIILNAELYDEQMQPLFDQEINLTLKDKNNKVTSTFTSLGNGLYEARINSYFDGDVLFVAEYKDKQGKTLKQSGNISIIKHEIEMLNIGRNKNYLNLLSNKTGGEYYDIENYMGLLDKLKVINSNQPNKFTQISQINLNSNYLILVVIVLLLSFEWLIRKLNYLK